MNRGENMIFEVVSKYHQFSKLDQHHRFRSWEHCFNFFRSNFHNLDDAKTFDHGCLHLAFYLASWGMLRASFLLQKDYRVHEYFLRDVVANPNYHKYFDPEFRRILNDTSIKGTNDLKKEIINTYKDHITTVNGQDQSINITDTLVSKILLGVYGNVPAYDRYFKEALKIHGIKQRFNENALQELVEFYDSYREDFEKCQRLFNDDGTVYTPMKLIDMYFWQVGFLMDNPIKNRHDLAGIYEFASNYAEHKAHRKSITFETVERKPIKNIGQTDQIRRYIIERLTQAKAKGDSSIDLKSGNVHKNLGLSNRMPSVCNAMVSLGVFRYEIINDTPSGKSSTRMVRYYLG